MQMLLHPKHSGSDAQAEVHTVVNEQEQRRKKGSRVAERQRVAEHRARETWEV